MMSLSRENNVRQVFNVHASSVSYKGSGVIIFGASGAGKSALALQLMAYGADLIADDQTVLTAENGTLCAAPPPEIKGVIEARGVGILTTDHLESAKIDLAIDLDRMETERLPRRHDMTLAGITIVCLHKVDSPHFPASILQYLRSGRRDP